MRAKEDRIKFASTIRKDLADKFDDLHIDTKIPKTRLHDEAIELLVQKYESKKKE